MRTQSLLATARVENDRLYERLFDYLTGEGVRAGVDISFTEREMLFWTAKGLHAYSRAVDDFDLDSDDPSAEWRRLV